MGKSQNSSQLTFVAIGLIISTNTQFVRIISGTDSCAVLDEQILPTDTARLEHFVLAVDDSGQVAFGLSMGVFFIYDLLNYTIQLTNYSSIWSMTAWYFGSQPTWYPGFIPFAIAASSIDSALVVGYQCDLVNFFCTPCAYYMTQANVQNPSTMPYLLLLPNEIVYQDYLYYISSNIMNMAISIQDGRSIALIGLSQYDTVVMIEFISTDIILIKSYISDVLGVGYGQSLVWLSNDTCAIVSLTRAISPWSVSRIEIVEFDSNNDMSAPLFTLPNSQQPADSSTSTSNILLVVVTHANLAILFGYSEVVLVIPFASASMCSQYSSFNANSIGLMQPTSCIPGTYNDITTVGPCKLCPTGTKNSGYSTISSCTACNSSSFCPLGSIADIPLSSVNNISQALAYPESPDSIIFDDILIQAMFSIGSTPSCILVSPLFWTVIVIAMALLLLSIVGILQLVRWGGKHRAVIVRIFRQTDLIGEGTLWMGGLMSFGIIVLVCFAYVFSNSFVYLYPIEKTNSVPFACDTTGILQLVRWGGKHRAVIVRIFRQTDLIGEGTLWMGGLMSFGIIVLVCFAYVFSNSFVYLYPIEKTNSVPFACDTTMRNAKFSTSLQLLATPRNQEEAPIFSLLDSQQFTLEVNFVQTLFNCSSLTIQQIIGVNLIQLPWLNCSYGEQIPATQTVSLTLPAHQMTLNFILGGPYYIGGAYVCLRGSSAASTGSIHFRQVLSFCQMFYTDNQTLAQATQINIQLTKVINRTTGLSPSDTTKYTGIWIPTFTIEAINDELVYFQQGSYLRYLTNVTTFQVTFVETPFFIKNTQDPIARQGEIIFHNVLFTIVALEIFGLVFLIVKLTMAPVFWFIVAKIQKKMSNRVGVVEDNNDAPIDAGQNLEAAQKNTTAQPGVELNRLFLR
ncbi:unnamed protein product [Adineta steineri]|uniref:Transmembrane protein n=1 Tax=Adineta steineri TaxID=433720 RepID=A0A814B1I5_9BILA|nr:unnamed protein product [Adineta steineri]